VSDTMDDFVKGKTNRRAIIHTVDISPAHSAHARKIVSGFRRGVYAPNVDFYARGLTSFFDGVQKSAPFLSHVLLDMPGSHEQLELVAKHMKDDAKLLVFNPSVTQISDCVQKVHDQQLPLRLDRVLELAGNLSGGREWDVRIARVRKPKQLEVAQSRSYLGRVMDAILNRPHEISHSSHAMVCRPMAGDRIVVGGFVGLWTKTK